MSLKELITLRHTLYTQHQTQDTASQEEIQQLETRLLEKDKLLKVYETEIAMLRQRL